MPARVARLAIRLYQYTLGVVLPNSCRFVPTCSHYAGEAIERFGLLRGAGLALRRLLRCHPWGPSGYDPVPDTLPAAVRPARTKGPNE